MKKLVGWKLEIVIIGDMYLLLKLKNKICTYFNYFKKLYPHLFFILKVQFNYFDEPCPHLFFILKVERDTWFDINNTFGVLFKISES